MRTLHRARGFLKPASLRWAIQSTFNRYRGGGSSTRPHAPDPPIGPSLMISDRTLSRSRTSFAPSIKAVHATSCDRATASDLVAVVRRIDDKAIDAGISVRDQCNPFM